MIIKLMKNIQDIFGKLTLRIIQINLEFSYTNAICINTLMEIYICKLYLIRRHIFLDIIRIYYSRHIR